MLLLPNFGPEDLFKRQVIVESSLPVGGRHRSSKIKLNAEIIRDKNSSNSISKIFIWQAIVRGQSVSTEGPFF
jgi:hypothetical protein